MERAITRRKRGNAERVISGCSLLEAENRENWRQVYVLPALLTLLPSPPPRIYELKCILISPSLFAFLFRFEVFASNPELPHNENGNKETSEAHYAFSECMRFKEISLIFN